MNCPEGKEIIVTIGDTAVVRGANRSMLQCDHVEADIRLVIHLQDSPKIIIAQTIWCAQM